MWSILLNSNTQWVLFSTMILGIATGTVGCLSYWKRQSLMSDSLAHAALPGVVLAFLLFNEKNLLFLISGAAISALIGAILIQGIRSSTRIKEDAAMGMILSIFYGFGIMLLTISNRVAGNQSGLSHFILGQAASMIKTDVFTMLMLAAIVLLVVITAFKEWKIYLFDPSFAKGLGFSLTTMNILYLLLLVTTIVIGIQAVGVILIAALLIIPAVSARYWTHSFKAMIVISAVIGGVSGTMGTILSAIGQGWPTGPFIVLTAASLFMVSLLFGKEKGILVKYWQFKRQRRQIAQDLFHTPFMKKRGFGK